VGYKGEQEEDCCEEGEGKRRDVAVNYYWCAGWGVSLDLEKGVKWRSTLGIRLDRASLGRRSHLGGLGMTSLDEVELRSCFGSCLEC
jgi:hypothetical protein